MKEPKTVTIYTRKGQNEERLLSFRVPSDFPHPRELLDHGCALDGNNALRSIPQTAPGGSFTERLLAAQKDITEFFERQGYTVDFR